MKKKLKKRVLSDIRHELLNLLIRRLLEQNESLEKGLLNSNVALRFAVVNQSGE